MKKNGAEARRDIDFSLAKRGAVLKSDPGKTKISIRLDNAVLDHFRRQVERAGGGNYQSLINDALLTHIRQASMVDTVREVVKQEVSASIDKLRSSLNAGRKRSKNVA